MEVAENRLWAANLLLRSNRDSHVLSQPVSERTVKRVWDMPKGCKSDHCMTKTISFFTVTMSGDASAHAGCARIQRGQTMPVPMWKKDVKLWAQALSLAAPVMRALAIACRSTRTVAERGHNTRECLRYIHGCRAVQRTTCQF